MSERRDDAMDVIAVEQVRRAARVLAAADALLIMAGAGMGVDSGLPDFRGDTGFWRAYPAYAALGLNFAAMANPRLFAADRTLAWGFYGHRLNLYRVTRPHQGFAILNRWAEGMPRGAFVVTSNVDGHFQRAGFDPESVCEVHGAIDWLQCTRGCGAGLFPAGDVHIDIDPGTMRASEPLPACPSCGALARPNILMFGDAEWDESRTVAQYARLDRWLNRAIPAGGRVAVVECGAGLAIPTIRSLSEQVAAYPGVTLVRINPRDMAVPAGHIGLPLAALPALRAIDEALPR